MTAVMTFAVQYVYDDRTTSRDELRPEHRSFLRSLLEAGSLLASGPTAGPERVDEPGAGADRTQVAPGALLLVRAASVEDACALLDADPFWRDGLVVARRVRGWDPVIGPWA
jgi:uncharacterized protein